MRARLLFVVLCLTEVVILCAQPPRRSGERLWGGLLLGNAAAIGVVGLRLARNRAES